MKFWEKSPRWLLVLSVPMFIGFTITSFLVTSRDKWRLGFLFIISGAFGSVLQSGPFGFARSFRAMISEGKFELMREVVLLIFSSSVFIEIVRALRRKFNFMPLFRLGPFDDLKDQPPCGVEVVLGSFMFGAGMQLGCGCASGTLVRMGEGLIKAIIVLFFFILGATFGCTDYYWNWWRHLPKTDGPVLLPWWANLIVLAILYFFCWLKDIIIYVKTKKAKKAAPNTFQSMDSINSDITDQMLIEFGTEPSTVSLVEQRFNIRPYIVDVTLGLITAVFYLCVGRRIGVAGVYPVIGAKFLSLFGIHPEKWEYFGGKITDNILDEPYFENVCFIILSSFVSSTYHQTFGVAQRNTKLDFIKAPFAGIIMGLGSKMAHGCNVGAMLSGIAARSVHGYLWTTFALAGTAVSLWTEKFIRMGIEKFRNNHQETYAAIE